MTDQPAAREDTATVEDTGSAITPPAAPAQRVGGGPGRGRWIAAIAVAGIAIAGIVAAIVVLGGRQTPEALRYIPGNALAVAEVRLDLPGDQLQKVGNLLAHFPGFRDQSILGDKIDEALDRVVGQATNGSKTYRADLKPWVAGPLFAAVLGTAGSSDVPERFVVSATTNGQVDCVTALGDPARATDNHRGIEVFTSGDPTKACARDGRQVLLGDPDSVRAALDAKADGTSIDASAQYRAARNGLAGDRLVTLYASAEALQQLAGVPGSMMGVPVASFPTDVPLPAWQILGVRAEDDALVLDAVTAPVPAASAGPSLLPLGAPHDSRLTSQVPGDAIAYAEVQGAGAAAQNALTTLDANPQLHDAVTTLRTAMNAVGGTRQLIGWVQDLGVYVGVDGAAPRGALLLEATSQDEATAHATQLEGLMRLAATTGGANVRETMIDGVRVVVFTPASGVAAGGVPSGTEDEIALAVHGSVVIAGLGEDSIRRVLAVQGSTSLAASAGFRHALDRGLGRSQVIAYLDARAAVALAEGLGAGGDLGTWRTEIKPYVDPVESIALTGTSDGSGARSRIVITVTTPASSPAPSQSQP